MSAVIDRYSQLLPDTPRIRNARSAVFVSSAAFVAATMIFWVFVRALVVALFYVMSLAVLLSPQISAPSFAIGMAVMFGAALCIMLFDGNWTAVATFMLLLFGYFPATAVMTHSLRGGYPLDPGSDLQLAAGGVMLAFCLYGLLEAYRTYRNQRETEAQMHTDIFLDLNEPKKEVGALATLIRRYVRSEVHGAKLYRVDITEEKIGVIFDRIDEETQVDLERFYEITGRRIYRYVAKWRVPERKRWQFWIPQVAPHPMTAFIAYRIGHEPNSETA